MGPDARHDDHGPAGSAPDSRDLDGCRTPSRWSSGTASTPASDPGRGPAGGAPRGQRGRRDRGGPGRHRRRPRGRRRLRRLGHPGPGQERAARPTWSAPSSTPAAGARLRQIMAERDRDARGAGPAVHRVAGPARRSREVDVDGYPVRVKRAAGRIKAEHDDAARVARCLGCPCARSSGGPRRKPTGSLPCPPTAPFRKAAHPARDWRRIRSPARSRTLEPVGFRRNESRSPVGPGSRPSWRSAPSPRPERRGRRAPHLGGGVVHRARRRQGGPGRPQRGGQDQPAQGPGRRRPACRRHGQPAGPARVFCPRSPAAGDGSRQRDDGTPAWPTSCPGGASTRRPSGWKSCAWPWRSTRRSGPSPASPGPRTAFADAGGYAAESEVRQLVAGLGLTAGPHRPAPQRALRWGAPPGRAGPHPLRRQRRRSCSTSRPTTSTATPRPG